MEIGYPFYRWVHYHDKNILGCSKEFIVRLYSKSTDLLKAVLGKLLFN